MVIITPQDMKALHRLEERDEQGIHFTDRISVWQLDRLEGLGLVQVWRPDVVVCDPVSMLEAMELGLEAPPWEWRLRFTAPTM